MLSVTDAAADGYCWAFSEECLYVLPDGTARLMIPSSYAADKTLTPAGSELLTRIPGTAPTIETNGDVNQDGEVNIADANIIYQLIIEGAAYYSIEQFTLYQRMLTDIDGNMMVTIEDLDAIINRICGAR